MTRPNVHEALRARHRDGTSSSFTVGLYSCSIEPLHRVVGDPDPQSRRVVDRCHCGGFLRFDQTAEMNRRLP